MAEDKLYSELKLTSGETLVLDTEDYEKVPFKDRWRVYMSKNMQFVGRWSVEGGKGTTKYLSSILFDYDRRNLKIVFKNGDRLDFRRANIEYVPRKGSTCQKNLANYTARRNNRSPEIRVNGCVLTKAGMGKRCAYYLKCDLYSKCLDEICAQTEWPGWTATCTPKVEFSQTTEPGRKLKLEI
jgi:hypothetical protein